MVGERDFQPRKESRKLPGRGTILIKRFPAEETTGAVRKVELEPGQGAIFSQSGGVETFPWLRSLYALLPYCRRERGFDLLAVHPPERNLSIISSGWHELLCLGPDSEKDAIHLSLEGGSEADYLFVWGRNSSLAQERLELVENKLDLLRPS